MKLNVILLASVMAFGFALMANSGAVTDTDGDTVADVSDNCPLKDNGPGEQSNQIDTDGDDFGNRCDPDFDQDNQVTASDFTLFLGVFPGPVTGADLEFDMDGDASALSGDFIFYLEYFPGSIL